MDGWDNPRAFYKFCQKDTLDGRKDNITGTIDLEYSLRHIMAECTDFKHKELALQYLGSQLGVKVLLTPKFHAELAGEGVEYSWAHANANYRRMSLSRKRGKETFKQLVQDCTCPVTVLTKERIEKFASRARAYVCTYHHLQQEQEKQHQQAALRKVENKDQNSLSQRTTPLFPNQILLYIEIERLMKAFKGHRCALDCDRGFVHSELRNAKIWIAELFGRSLLWDNVCRCKKRTRLYARRVECETCHTKMILQYLHYFEIPGILY